MFEIDREIVDLLISWSTAVGRSIAIPDGDASLRINSGNGEVCSTFWGNVGFRFLGCDRDYKALRVKKALEQTDHVFILYETEHWIYLAKEKLLGKLAVWRLVLREEGPVNGTF